jgi:hypothetical protein
MKATAVLILLLGTAQACRGMDPRQPREAGEAQIVALVVRSEPAEAIVKVNKLGKTWKTPCDIADWSLSKGPIEVEVSLAGYETLRTKVQYGGSDPVILQVRLRPVGGVAPAEIAPAPAPAAKVQEPAPLKAETTPGGTWLKTTTQGARIRIEAKTVVTDPSRPGEIFLPNVPPEKVRVEFLDPKTDVVLHTVEFAPGAGPATGGRAPEPKDPPPALTTEADRVGEVKVVSKTYGVYVKLDSGLAVQPGEEVVIFRDGKEIARTKILKVTKSDNGYPDGAVQVPKDGSIQKGDEVRRTKP